MTRLLPNRNFILKSAACLLLSLAIPLQAARAQDKPVEMNFAVLTFPSMSNTIMDVILAKGFDRANGIIAKPVPYGTAGALWAAVAKGEIPAHSMGPYTLPQIKSTGVPIAIYGTLMRLSSEQIITKNPAIKKLEDLKGKSIAAMVGFPEYDYLQMYARKIGFELADNITVVNATPALARTQLEAGRVDASMFWEPSATMFLRSNPDARVILTGDEMWRGLTGTTGWQGMLFVNTDIARANPGMVEKLLKIYQQAGSWLNANPDEGDEIVSSNKYISRDIPKGTIADAVKNKRLNFDVQPSWDPAINKSIWEAFKLGVEYKVLKTMPSEDSVISTRPR
jgi:ABC-type nitrate/sulfonate/bicarbonate transport system substrate-binding protein